MRFPSLSSKEPSAAFAGRRRQLFLAALALAFCLPMQAPAETAPGTITGMVLDSETHRPVEHASVWIEEVNKVSFTAADGSFDITDIATGVVTVKVSHPGYREITKRLAVDSSGQRRFLIFLDPRVYEVGTVVVTSEHTHTKFEDIHEQSSVLQGKELQKELGLTLAATLRNETGLAMRTMGPAPARPVIRGLGGDRVHISEDGQKTTDLSATSPDHAVTIEPFSVDRIEVIRGPKVVTQSSTTIGGVINVIRHEIPQDQAGRMTGSLGVYGETADRGHLGSLVAEIPVHPFMLRGEISRRKTDDLRTPAGYLKNSGSGNLNFSAGGSWIMDNGFVGVSMRDFALDYGVPGGFVGAHPNGVDIRMKKRTYNFRSRMEFHGGPLQSVETHLSRSLYRHKEYESNGSIGTDFSIADVAGSLHVHHGHSAFFDRGTVGVSFEHRDFDIGGNVFTPSSGSLNLAGFVYEAFSLGGFSCEAGARYAFDRIRPVAEDRTSNIGHIRERTFHTYALCLSALHPISSELSAGINLNRSARVPTIEELYSEGPHLAAYSYEVGDPDLAGERGVGAEVFVHYKSAAVYLLVSGFYNHLSNYLIPRNTGTLNWRLILPVYQTEGVAARLYGGEAELRWELTEFLAFRSSVSRTIGTISRTGTPLPAIPPLKGRVEITGSAGNLSLGLSSDWAARQDRVDEFEEPTEGYIVFHGSVQYTFLTGRQAHSLSLTMDNILDTEYRNHLSRVRAIMPEAGRNFRLTYKLFFEA